MSGKINSKTEMILITGASSGIGLQLALDLVLEERKNVILVDKNYSGLVKVKKSLVAKAKHRQQIQIFKCDISLSKDVEMLQTRLKAFNIGVLINNAGIFYSGQFESMNINHFEKVIQTNLLGSVRLTKAFLPQIKKSQTRKIIMVASLAGLVGAPGMCAYSTAKFGLVGFSQSLALELKGRVRVCTICPSFVKTNIANNALFTKNENSHGRRVAKKSINQFIEKMGADPKKVSKIIVQAIESRKELILINPDAYFFYYLNKFFPAACTQLITGAYNKLIRLGVVPS